MSRMKYALPVLVSLALITPLSPSTAASKIPTVVVQSGGFPTKIIGVPKRIISLSPTATETLFAIGAGSQVIAVDDLSNYPANAPITKLSAFTPNVEALAAKRPDLIILSVDSTNSMAVRKSLNLLNIPVLMEKAPSQLSDAYSEILAMGLATSHVAKAKALVATMKTSINKIVSASKRKNSLTFFHELDSTLYSATSKTFIGHVYADFNLINIADKAAGADASGYPQLSQEYLITANPQIIFLGDAQYGENAKTLAGRPGWSAIDAVKYGHVVELPSDIPSRWGPRLVQFYQFIADSIAKIN
ncbi:MAG: ABC transporter substrate-binding protein [Actinomycetes bacterium]